MLISRYSAKCLLCGQKWTTEERDRTKAFDKHSLSCTRYAEKLARRMASGYAFSEVGERYQMSALYFKHLQIEGRLIPTKACDGRCMSATGPNCECSCGGKNHGVGATL